MRKLGDLRHTGFLAAAIQIMKISLQLKYFPQDMVNTEAIELRMMSQLISIFQACFLQVRPFAADPPLMQRFWSIYACIEVMIHELRMKY